MNTTRLGDCTTNIKIDYRKCRGCSTYTCVDCCAKAVYKLENSKPVVVDLDSCTMCTICTDLCLKKAITIEK